MTLWLAPTASPPSKGIKGTPESSEACELFLETPGQQSMNNRAKMRGWEMLQITFAFPSIIALFSKKLMMKDGDDDDHISFGSWGKPLELSGKFNWQCSLPWDRIQPKMRKRLFCFVFFTNSIVWTDRYKADAVQNVVKEPRTQHFHSGLFTVLSGVMMIDHLQFHQFHGLVDNPAIDQNSSKTSSKEKTPPPFPNYNNNERDKSFNNKKTLWSAKLISPGQWHTAHKIYFSIVKLSFCLFLNKDSNRSFNW